VNKTPDLFPAGSITPQEWDWVQELIQEVQRQELREAFATGVGSWDLAVRQFRRVEMRRIITGTPTEKDRLHHAICLHALLAFGKVLVLEARRFSDADLAGVGIAQDQIAAYVAELEQSLREWHHGISEAELNAARQRIFGAAA
jgi:hypothetical protein